MPRPAVRQAQAVHAQAAKAVNVRATPRPVAAVPRAQAQNMCARKAHPLHVTLRRASTAEAEATAQAVHTTEAPHQAAAITEAARLQEAHPQVQDAAQAAATVAEVAVQAPVEAVAAQVVAVATALLAVAVVQAEEEDNFRATTIN